MDARERHTGYTHMALEINDREVVLRRLDELNIPITKTVELEDGTYFFIIRDPDDNVIEFHHPII